MVKPKITEAEVSAFLAYAKGHNVPDGYDDLPAPEKMGVIIFDKPNGFGMKMAWRFWNISSRNGPC